MNFIINNEDNFKANPSIRNIISLNAELNPIYHLTALNGAHHILHVSRIRVNTRNKHGLHRRNVDLSCIQSSIFYAGSKILTI